ncbi:MAG: hypothetical protein GY696_19395 [Gammaproteobacteria bacterium]|nr:hypothetical protein [Gammaproteobacteria bacterium]
MPNPSHTMVDVLKVVPKTGASEDPKLVGDYEPDDVSCLYEETPAFLKLNGRRGTPASLKPNGRRGTPASSNSSGHSGHPDTSGNGKRNKRKERNRRQRQRRKERKAAAKEQQAPAVKPNQDRATKSHGQIIVSGDGATLRYNPVNRSVHLNLGNPFVPGRMSAQHRRP